MGALLLSVRSPIVIIFKYNFEFRVIFSYRFPWNSDVRQTAEEIKLMPPRYVSRYRAIFLGLGEVWYYEISSINVKQTIYCLFKFNRFFLEFSYFSE